MTGIRARLMGFLESLRFPWLLLATVIPLAALLPWCIRLPTLQGTPLNGLLGSTAIIPTVLLRRRNSLAIWVVKVLLPDPGGPVRPMM
jgi:hypothetical protein